MSSFQDWGYRHIRIGIGIGIGGIGICNRRAKALR
jgi:hypothetical protein